MPANAERDAAQIVVITHAGQHQFDAVRCFTRRTGSAAAVLGHPLFGFGKGAVIDGDVESGAGQVAGHGISHDTQAEKCNTTFCVAGRRGCGITHCTAPSGGAGWGWLKIHYRSDSSGMQAGRHARRLSETIGAGDTLNIK
jgi:hypothetical protein